MNTGAVNEPDPSKIPEWLRIKFDTSPADHSFEQGPYRSECAKCHRNIMYHTRRPKP